MSCYRPAMPEWPFEPPLSPMEARVRERMPEPPGWAYEPKWDGFRALAWSGGASYEARLDSRNRKPLLRYFPELTPALEALPSGTVVDAEVLVVIGDASDFDALQQRIHPAASRIERLSGETPASLVAFDLLAQEGEDLRDRPFAERRERLAVLLGGLGEPWRLTPSTEDLGTAHRWFEEFEAAGCDGIVAKRLDGRYVEGKRELLKIKRRRSVDAVVGGYRLHKQGDRLGSLLLGLYDEAGAMHFVGHTSGFPDEQRIALLGELSALAAEDSFGEEARRPGAESRWSGGRDTSWTPVRPEVVVQVSYDQISGGRFRHATRFERFRPDKDPAECTLEQIERDEGLRFHHPPVYFCTKCYDEDAELAFADVSGRGTVYSYYIHEDSDIRAFGEKTPYPVVMVELEEQAGLFVLANLLDCDYGQIAAGMPVEVVFERASEEIVFPQFRPAREGSAG